MGVKSPDQDRIPLHKSEWKKRVSQLIQKLSNIFGIEQQESLNKRITPKARMRSSVY
jgi:hypothetical protein